MGRQSRSLPLLFVIIIVASLTAPACKAEFAVDLEVVRAGLPIPASVAFDIFELDAPGGAIITMDTLTVPGADLFADKGNTNRILIRTNADAGAVRVSASATDVAGFEIGSGLVEVPRENAVVDATLTLMGSGGTDGGTDAGSDTGTDSGSDSGSACGNGVIEGIEVCDGLDLGGASCTSLGHTSGALACAVDCLSFNEAGCGDCPNGAVDGTEACDGADLDMNDCTTVAMGYIGGTLGCMGDCSFDVSSCTAPPNCGNGMVEPGMGEDCDGVDLNGEDCASATAGILTMGTLACGGGCLFDASGCNECGNGAVEGPEVCDPPDFGADNCLSLGHTAGSVDCLAGCLGYDEGPCTDCGDGMQEGAEDCDGADLAMNDCTTVGMFSGGTLDCVPAGNPGQCSFDTAMCWPPPTVPALRKPINNSYFGSVHVPGSMRPTFTWEASTVAGGSPVITYDLEYSTDQTFMTGVTLQMTTGLSFQPAADLPVAMMAPVGDRYYWRVRACAGGTCSAWSPTWWVNVGRERKDYNGDGYADVAIGARGQAGVGSNSGAVTIFFGGSGPLDTTPDGLIGGEGANSALGNCVPAGDVNGDGFGDLLVAAFRDDIVGTDAGRAYIFYGGAGATFDTTAEGTFPGEATNDWFGWGLAGVGDVNGDGYDDILISARQHDTAGSNAGRAYFYLGGPGATFDITPELILDGPAADALFGHAVGGGGDVNGDGYADWIIGAEEHTTVGFADGEATVYFGSPTPDGTADLTLVGLLPGDRLGNSVDIAGDVNGDGFSDLVVGARTEDTVGGSAGAAYIHLGGLAGPPVAPDASLYGRSATAQFGHAVGPAGDINGDGYDDVLVTARFDETLAPDQGAAFIYLGGPASFDTTADYTFEGEATLDEFGFAAASLGDVDGDGWVDIGIGGWLNDGAFMNAGRFYLYLGGATFDVTNDLILDGGAVGDGFGVAIASLWPSSSERLMCGGAG